MYYSMQHIQSYGSMELSISIIQYVIITLQEKKTIDELTLLSTVVLKNTQLSIGSS